MAPFLVVLTSNLSRIYIRLIQWLGADIGDTEKSWACLSSAMSLLFLCSAGCLKGLMIFRLYFPDSPISWFPAGLILWEALEGDGREKGREKPCFFPSPSLSWVVSPVVVASLPGLWILLDSCAVIPAPVWWSQPSSFEHSVSSFAPASCHYYLWFTSLSSVRLLNCWVTNPSVLDIQTWFSLFLFEHWLIRRYLFLDICL